MTVQALNSPKREPLQPHVEPWYEFSFMPTYSSDSLSFGLSTRYFKGIHIEATPDLPNLEF